MAYDAHKNFAKGTLTNSPGLAGTSFVLGSGEGANFAANMPVTIVPSATQPDSTNSEIGYITSIATDTLTITRAQQGTTAKNAATGWLVLGTITTKALTDLESRVGNDVTSITSSYSALTTDDIILADATSGNITITLPSAVGRVRPYRIKKTDSSANTVTVATTSSQTIDGVATAVLGVQFESITIVSNNSNWLIV